MSNERNSTSADAAIADLMDAQKRREIIADPRQYAKDIGVDVDGKEVVAVKCTANVLYFPIQRAGGDDLSAEQLRGVAAAGGDVPAGTAGSLGTIGTICSTYSSAGTVGSAGCG